MPSDTPATTASPLVDALFRELAGAVRSRRASPPRPGSTYRLQLTKSFGFLDAARVVPYLAALGVTDLYLSPILVAVRGSTHGYDVVDHDHLAPELGGAEGYAGLCEAAAAHGLGQLVDFVPNHMGIGRQNAWWMDVLENGPSSRWAHTFDIDWKPVKGELENKVLVPTLGDQYGVVLENGELSLVREGGTFFVAYYTHRFPLSPRSVPQVLRHRLEELRTRLGPDEPSVWELESICTSLEKLAPRSETDPAKVAERAREKEVAKRRLHALLDAEAAVREHVDGNLAIFNGKAGDPRSFDRLDALLDAQAYRLAHWRVAGEEINYRRFFDVNGLAAIRMEDDRVFEEAHRLVLDLVRQGKITGLRIDHPDGLYDPTAYFRRLQASALVARGRALAGTRGETLDADAAGLLRDRLERELLQGEPPARPFYVLAEKILSGKERMPESWAIDGTTGYEFLAAASGLFVDGEAEEELTGFYGRFTGLQQSFDDLAYEKKRLITGSSMASEINMLAHRLNGLSETNRRTRDFTLNALRRAIVEFVSSFPVYRTYVTPAGEIDDRDRRYVERTLARARRRSLAADPSIFDFLRDVLLLRYPESLSPAERRDWLEFTLKLQQVTGPVTAKALEDTAFYVYDRLVSLNEVGGEPGAFGTSPVAFHKLNAERLAHWPGSLSGTSTHDTKRSEDVRVRIAAVSEVPREWRALVSAWARANRRFKVEVDGAPAPDRNDELLVYQTLLGTFLDEVPAQGSEEAKAYLGRITAYLEKALREAKSHSSWTNPDEEYEDAAKGFAAAVLVSPEFLETFVPFARKLAHAARVSSLTQVALKLASPGVCDVYQGCELWDLSLVDPDNRRAVDFSRRSELLGELERRAGPDGAGRAALARELSTPQGLRDGRAKLLLLREGLHHRKANRELYLEGAYLPLPVEGEDAGRVIAFARTLGQAAVVCVAPRLVLGPAPASRVWRGEVRLPAGFPAELEDLVTGARRKGAMLDLGELLAGFPVALLATR